MGVKLVDHAEDLALGVGSIVLSTGVGIAFGFGFGLIAFGALLVAWGVWISPRPGGRS
jgi:hypothetical protein